MCTVQETVLLGPIGLPLLWEIITTTAAVLFIIFMKQIQNFSVETVKAKQAKKQSPEVIRLTAEVKELQNNLNKISPTSEFAAYFKTERVLNKVKSQLETELASQNGNGSNMKLALTVRTILQAVGFVVLYLVSGIQAFCISSNYFWPFNFFLRIPFSDTSACERCDYDAVPVSLFNVIFIFIATIRKMMF